MTARLPDTAVATRTAASAGPALVAGAIMHRRTRPTLNAFRYPAFCLRLPLSRLHDLEASGVRCNRRGLVSFHERDHGPRDGTPLAVWVRQLLAREGIIADGEIVLHAFPRMLGYVFNPVTFWVCHDAAGGVRAVLAEVSNTFGETHRYLLAHADGRPLASGETLVARKRFHVSPFCPVRGHYAFRFRFGDDRWLARVDYFDGEGGPAPLLETSISGSVQPLPAHAASLFLRYRWFTLGVVTRIHWQAAKLWWRRVPFFSKPAPPGASLSRNE
jgi:uncharacterized protein